jgi:hypothetical protein
MENSYLLYNLYPQKETARFNLIKGIHDITINKDNYPFIGQILSETSTDKYIKDTIGDKTMKIIEECSVEKKDLNDSNILLNEKIDSLNKVIESHKNTEIQLKEEIKSKKEEIMEGKDYIEDLENKIKELKEELKKKETPKKEEPKKEPKEEPKGKQKVPKKEVPKKEIPKEVPKKDMTRLYNLFEEYLQNILEDSLEKKKFITDAMKQLSGIEILELNISDKKINRNQFILYKIKPIIELTTLKEKEKIINFMDNLAMFINPKNLLSNYHSKIIYHIIYNENKESEKKAKDFEPYLKELKISYLNLPKIENSDFLAYE